MIAPTWVGNEVQVARIEGTRRGWFGRPIVRAVGR